MTALPGPGPEARRPMARSYDTTRRREQAVATRERIVTAGTELLHAGSIRDWKRLTVRAVADRAGVSERTVYRHFGNERGLTDAVMHRLEREAGIELEGMGLDDVGSVASRILGHVASYPLGPRPSLDATLVDANRRQKDALLAAVTGAADPWPEEDRVLAAALLDVLWSVEAFERLVGDWRIDPDRAIGGLAWVIGLVGEAVHAAGARVAGDPGPSATPPSARRLSVRASPRAATWAARNPWTTGALATRSNPWKAPGTSTTAQSTPAARAARRRPGPRRGRGRASRRRPMPAAARTGRRAGPARPVR